MKRVFLLLVITAFAAVAFGKPSYDAITGQTFTYAYLPGEFTPVADDTTLANLDPVQSIDLVLQNFESHSDFYTVGLTVYNTDPSSGLPGSALTSVSELIFIDADQRELVNFAFPTLWTPPTTDLWTGITISGGPGGSGGPNLAWNIPDAAPTVGSSQDEFAVFQGSQWNAYYFGGTPVANFAVRYNAVPEPCSVAVMGFGVIGLFVRRRRK